MFEVRSSKLKSDVRLEANLEPRASNASEFSSIGRVGELVLDYVRQGDRTILTHSRCCSPWHFSPPIQLDDSPCAYTPLVNPSGGLVGGDRLNVRAVLGADAHVIFSTPSANRVYRSLGETALQTVDLTVGPDAILEWMPDVTIPFSGSRFKQTIHVTLAPGATVLLWDAIASGRVARGERWAFARLDNEIMISTADKRSVIERYQLAPSQDGVGLAEPWDYVASLFVIGDAIEAAQWTRLRERIAERFEDAGPAVLGGVSEPAAPGVVVKLLAQSAPDLSETFDWLWGTVRSVLWNLPKPALRRY